MNEPTQAPDAPAQTAPLAVAPCSALSAKSKPEKINARLFDLVRYMRAELHEADLITDAEYGWLCSEAALATGNGSPSPRRLEDYDKMRRRLAELEKQRL